MKITQETPPKQFHPITITLETREDYDAMLNCMLMAAGGCVNPNNVKFAELAVNGIQKANHK